MSGGRRILRRESKAFFFEKKKQKTSFYGASIIGSMDRARGQHGQKFFGSFFKKEQLHFSPPSPIWPAARR
jgi:hypothetical protein